MAPPQPDSRSPGHDSDASSNNSTMAALEAFYKARGNFTDLYVVDDVDDDTAALVTSSTQAAASNAVDSTSVAAGESINRPADTLASASAGDTAAHATSSGLKRKLSSNDASDDPQDKSTTARKTSARGKAKAGTIKKSSPVDPEFTRVTRASALASGRSASVPAIPASVRKPRKTNRAVSTTAATDYLFDEGPEKKVRERTVFDENILSGYSIKGKYHKVKLHASREKHLDEGREFAGVPSGALFYPGQTHQNVANLPEQHFMDLRPNDLELESDVQDADLLLYGATPEQIKTAHDAMLVRKKKEASGEKTKAHPSAERMRLRDILGAREKLRDAISRFEEFDEIKDDKDISTSADSSSANSTPTKRKGHKIAARKTSTAQPARRSKRKASDDSDSFPATLASAQSVEAGILAPVSKKRKTSGSSDDSALLAEPRRSKRKASQVTATTSPDQVEDSIASSEPSKKRKIDTNTATTITWANVLTGPVRRTSTRNASKTAVASALQQSVSHQAASSPDSDGGHLLSTKPLSDSPTAPDHSGDSAVATFARPISAPSQSAAVASSTPAPATQPTPKKSTSKKAAKLTISGDYAGLPSGHGYSTNAPPEAELTTPWQCGEQSCASGMTWLTRNRNAADGQAVGRKVISHFFGRNKTSTKLIPEDVWHWLCRKHYQRDKYAHDRAHNNIHPHQATCLWFLDNIEHQLVRLQLWRPQATFSVKLMSGAEKRVNNWFAELRKHNGNQQAAIAALPASAANSNPTAEKDFPILLLEHCQDNFVGVSKTYIELRQILAWIRNEVNAGNTPVVAPVEFLLDAARAGEVINDPVHNYQEWEAHLAGRTFDPASAYTPGQAAKPCRPAIVFKPFTPVDPSRFEDETTSDDPTGAMIRNAEKMGMVYKPKKAVTDSDNAEQPAATNKDAEEL